jgi:hypothetical protein
MSAVKVLGRLLLACFVAVAVPSCSDWPPGEHGDDGDGTGGSSSGPVTNGTCSGTPVPCTSLNTQQCAASPGCIDNGVCAGSGFCDNARSPALCAEAEGCYWSGQCQGTPTANCRGTTQALCLSNPGCSWSESSSNTGGSSSGSNSCNTFNTLCATQDQCGECGFRCLQLSPTLSAVCGKLCRSDGDCAGTIGAGQKTPYCAKVDSTSTTGACTVSR